MILRRAILCVLIVAVSVSYSLWVATVLTELTFIEVVRELLTDFGM